MHLIEQTYNFKSNLATRGTTSVILLHHAAAASATPQQIHNWHIAAGYAGIGYHFLIAKDGTVHRGRPQHTVGAHAIGHNGNSLGICFEGNFENESMPEAQLAAGRELITYLRNHYGNLTIKQHKDVAATACPGRNFPLDRLVSDLPPVQTAKPDQKPLFSHGSKGEKVREIQSLLNYYGYASGAVDGIFGDRTKAAVIAFQRANGLSADGIVGPLTWARLQATPNYAPNGYARLLKLSATYMKGEDVRKVQARLNALGHNCGAADGIYGPKTASAVRAFQQSQSLSPDGQVGPLTWNKLF